MIRHTKHLLLRVSGQIGVLKFLQIPMHEAGNHLFVLAYHRVAAKGDPISRQLYDLVSASPYQFDEQMHLISTCFRPVTAEDILNALHGGKPLPPQAVLVTVDDGYRDFREVIFPIAKKYGIYPVLFIPTAFVGGGIFWWDRLYSAVNSTTSKEVDTPLGRLSLNDELARQATFDLLANHVRMQPFEKAREDIERLCEEIAPNMQKNFPYTLDWGELRTLAAEGVTIAPHTHTHPILTHIPIENAREEVRVSQMLIKQEVGYPLPIFAYPDGRSHAVSIELAAMLRQEGIQLAFTMSDHLSRLKQDDPRLFPRLIPDRSTTLAQFHLRLTALYQAKNSSKNRSI